MKDLPVPRSSTISSSPTDSAAAATPYSAAAAGANQPGLSAPVPTTPTAKASKWSAASGFFGAISEYYDFALYAPAAVLFLGPLFFAPLGEWGQTLAAFASFAVAYFARPLGALIFGQLGDRYGRRLILLTTLSIMGISTTLIGLLPTYETMGVLAPVLLVILRIMQGLSAGVEQSGSGTLAAENAPKNKRALYTSWTMIGVSIGWFSGPAVLSALSGMNVNLLDFWWRVPFLLSFPLLVISFWIRWQVPKDNFSAANRVKTEASPKDHPDTAAALDQATASNPASSDATVPADALSDSVPVSLPAAQQKQLSLATERSISPLRELLRTHPWELLRVIACSLHMLVGVTFNVFVLSWAVKHSDFSQAEILSAISIAGISTAFLQPLWAWQSDRLGRRKIFIASCLSLVVLLPVVFLAITTGQYLLMLGMMIVFYTAVMAGNVVQASFYAEIFPRHLRMTGTSVSTQLGLVIVGLSPLLYSYFEHISASFVPGCIFAGTCWVIAAVSAYSLPETAHKAQI